METIQISKIAPNMVEINKIKARGAKILDVKYIEEVGDDGETTKLYQVKHTPFKTQKPAVDKPTADKK